MPFGYIILKKIARYARNKNKWYARNGDFIFYKKNYFKNFHQVCRILTVIDSGIHIKNDLEIPEYISQESDIICP